MHYTIQGTGRIIFEGRSPVEVSPNTLMIFPPNTAFSIQVKDADGAYQSRSHADSRAFTFDPNEVRRFFAAKSQPDFVMICGYFHAVFGESIELFSKLQEPIFEVFSAADHIDRPLNAALDELVAQEVGYGVMTTVLLKQVLIKLLRKSLVSPTLWAERFSMLRDPQVAKAFAEMVKHPGAGHSVESLASVSGLSRSAFMSRFAEALGLPPMSVLRQLRMRQAATLLEAGTLSIDQIANAVGYSSRSSFFKAFQKVYACEPSEYRRAPVRPDDI